MMSEKGKLGGGDGGGGGDKCIGRTLYERSLVFNVNGKAIIVCDTPPCLTLYKLIYQVSIGFPINFSFQNYFLGNLIEFLIIN
jgi:hypothetical protein